MTLEQLREYAKLTVEQRWAIDQNIAAVKMSDYEYMVSVGVGNLASHANALIERDKRKRKAR